MASPLHVYEFITVHDQWRLFHPAVMYQRLQNIIRIRCDFQGQPGVQGRQVSSHALSGSHAIVP